METRLPVVLTAVLAATCAATAQGSFNGSQLSLVGEIPKQVAFEERAPAGMAILAVTLRNDSRFRGPLKVRLALDDGTTVRMGESAMPVIVDKQRIVLRLRRNGQRDPRIGPRDVRRIKVQFHVEPIPKSALSGTLIVSAGRDRRVSPLAVAVSAAPKLVVAVDRLEKAKVQPPSIVVIARRHSPSFFHHGDVSADPQEVVVKGLAGGDAITAATLDEPVAGDTGGRGVVRLTRPAIGGTATEATIRVDVRSITDHGTYETAIPLDPDAEKSPTVTVKVLAGDLFVYPLALLLVGVGLAYLRLRKDETERPKQLLKLALSRLKDLHDENKRTPHAPVPYTLDVFPDSGEWANCTRPEREAHQLYCRIERADLKEDLDTLTQAIADLDARVRAWPIALAKTAALAAKRKELPDVGSADAMRAACSRLETVKEAPTDRDATDRYFKQIDAQIEAVDLWLDCWAMFDEAADLHWKVGTGEDPDAELLRRHDPRRWLPDLVAAESAADLDRCRVLRGLCGDVHALRSARVPAATAFGGAPGVAVHRLDEHVFGLLPMSEEDRAAIIELVESRTGSVTGPPTLSETAPLARGAGPLEVTPSPSVTAGLLADLRAGDRVSFWWALSVALLAFFLGIYDQTFGSDLEYLGVFAAGAGSTFVANFRLLPWFRSYKVAKAE